MSDDVRQEGDLLLELTRLKAASDPRTVAEIKAVDRYSESVVKSAERYDGGWSINLENSTGFGITDKRNPEGLIPEPGTMCRLYSSGGSEFHGVDLDGREVFWRTPWEQFADRIAWLADHDRRQRERFDAERHDLDHRYDALSDPMKARIDRFRAAEPDFRVKSEAYESFTCAQADAFAARAIEAADADDNRAEVDAWFGDGSFEKEHPGQAQRPASELTPAVRWLLWWSKRPYDRQRELCPAMDEGHSGNTFGGAWYFAVRLLLGEEC